MTQGAEPVCHDLIWDVGLAMDGGDRVTATDDGAGTLARWLPELRHAVGRSSARLVLSLMVWGREGSKTERMARGFLPRVQCDEGWPQGGCRRRLGLLELRRRRTASPEVLRP
jgi:hypothetical protein